jgi:hypothetical protein
MRENKVSNSSSQCAQVFNYVISFLRPQKKEEKKNCEIKKATRKKKILRQYGWNSHSHDMAMEFFKCSVLKRIKLLRKNEGERERRQKIPSVRLVKK